jgi:hypothetical protein
VEKDNERRLSPKSAATGNFPDVEYVSVERSVTNVGEIRPRLARIKTAQDSRGTRD